MLTWEQLLADLRSDMDDTGTPPRLSTERAFLYFRFAVQDYSEWNPRIMTTTLDLDDDGMAPLPDDFINVIEIRHPDTHNLILPASQSLNPPRSAVIERGLRWWLEGSSFRMNTWADSPDTVSVLYNARHAIPDDHDDTTAEMSFPEADEEAILLYMRAKYMGTTRSKTAMLDRYKRRTDAGNTRRDNPIGPEEQNLMDEYLAFMIAKYGSSGAIHLTRSRR